MNKVFSSLLLHPNTSSQLESFAGRPASVLLISGRRGSGKKTLAKHLAAGLLAVEPAELLNQPYFIVLSKPQDKTEISIDSVRQLIGKMNLKVPAGASERVNRVAVVEDAHYLSTEAQNALLKLLEEPPAGTLLVLTSDSEDNLLPTVVSRAQRITLAAPTLEQSLEFFSGYPPAKVESAWRLSQGGAGLLSALLADEASHPLKLAVAQAKEFIAADAYKRLLLLQNISKDKANFVVFLDALARVLSALHTENIKKEKYRNAEKILNLRRAVENALAQLEHSSNVRLTSLSLALNSTL